MTTFGLDPVLGFVKRTLPDIVQQYGDDEVALISPSLDVSETSPMGQINGAIAKVAAELWDQLQAVEAAGDPDRNTGAGQDAVCAITGTSREAASSSQVELILGLSATTTITQGAKVSAVGNPLAIFQLVGPEPAPGQPVVPGPVTSTVAGPYNGRFASVNTGPIAANAGTLSVIVNPITGWLSAFNPLDAALGHDIEGPSALRIRREVELNALGSTPVDALRGKLYKLLAVHNIVGFVDVIDNFNDTVDVDGRPGHSIECLIDDGPDPVSNDEIAQVIWDNRAGGTKTFGSTVGVAIDDLGVSRSMSFNRPILVPIYITVQLSTVGDLPADADAQIKNALVAHGQTLKMGADVICNSFFGGVFSLPFVATAPALFIGIAPTPVSSADLVISVRSRAVFDTSRIIVTYL